MASKELKSTEKSENDKKPSEVFDEEFIWCIDEDLENKWGDYPKEKGGKWMMFFKKKDLDEKWELAKKCYLEEKLEGITCMKISTMMENERKKKRASDDTKGVIIFYCGPEDDEKKVVSYGNNLLKHIPYANDCGVFYYKSDRQSKMGTQGTGKICNSKYRIQIPKSTAMAVSEKNPTEVFDVSWIRYSEENIASKYASILQGSTGKWMMFFEIKDLDEKWNLAKRCYRERKLNGIMRLEVSTMFDSPKRFPGQHGVILFYCGPCSNEELMKDYGRNLLIHIPYPNSTGMLSYKSFSQSVLGTRATGNKSNSLYQIKL